jgi:hypothetical protein
MLIALAPEEITMPHYIIRFFKNATGDQGQV